MGILRPPLYTPEAPLATKYGTSFYFREVQNATCKPKKLFPKLLKSSCTLRVISLKLKSLCQQQQQKQLNLYRNFIYL